MGRTSNARERLVEAAAHLFHSNGYNAVGVGDICREADVKRGSFYHFFETKEELAVAGLEHISGEMQSTIGELVENPELTAFEKMSSLTQMMTGMYLEIGVMGDMVFGCPMGNVAAELSTQNENLRLYVEQKLDMMVGFFEAIIQQGVQEGSIAENVDARTQAMDAVSYMQGLILMSKVHKRPELIERLTQGMLNVAGFVDPK